MPRLRPIVALLALGGSTACAETPSYALRWTIEGKGEASVATCAESGLFQVRTRAYRAPGAFFDERFYACAAEALLDVGEIAGPTLGQGQFAIELRGIDRAFHPWDDPIAVTDPDAPVHVGCNPITDYTECRPNERVCDCLRLDVDEDGHGTLVGAAAPSDPDEPPTLVFSLEPPMECEDGIDNDHDGHVDAADPSCTVDFADGTEGIPVGVTDFEISVSLLGHNPAAVCSSLPQLTEVQVDMVREDAEPVTLLLDRCQLEAPYRFSALLPPGLATFSVFGVDARPGVTPQPVTHPFVFQHELLDVGNLVRQSVDFAPADFLEPIVGRMLFSFGYRLSLGDSVGPRASCSSQPGRGLLTVDGLRLTMLDAHGGAIDPPVRLADGTVLDGSTVLPCVAANLQTEVVDWTEGYALRVEALSPEGEVCFQRDLAPMRPEEPLFLELARAYDGGGSIAASCHDCQTDADCHPDDHRWRCIDDTCQYPCNDDLDCQPEVLGDAFACLIEDGDAEAYCRRQ